MKIYKTSAVCVGTWFLLMMGMALPARAQVAASSFDELRSALKLRKAESVQITDNTGKKFDAKIAEISDHTISVTDGGVRRQLSELDVREITHYRHGNARKGALIGLGVGAGFGALAVVLTCHPLELLPCGGWALVSAAAWGGIGAGIGAPIAYVSGRHETVFARPHTSSNPGLAVSPIISKDKKGVNLSFSF